MRIDPAILANYRHLIVTTKESLAQNQFQHFVNTVQVSPTKRLEKSYHSLFKAIDKYPMGDYAKILNHRFLFEILKASPTSCVKELQELEFDKKDEEFHHKWIGELRERLDTRDNK